MVVGRLTSVASRPCASLTQRSPPNSRYRKRNSGGHLARGQSLLLQSLASSANEGVRSSLPPGNMAAAALLCEPTPAPGWPGAANRLAGAERLAASGRRPQHPSFRIIRISWQLASVLRPGCCHVIILAFLFQIRTTEPIRMSDGSGSEGETYEVEKILDKRMVKGKAQYFIKWKGKLMLTECHLSSRRCLTYGDNKLIVTMLKTNKTNQRYRFRRRGGEHMGACGESRL